MALSPEELKRRAELVAAERQRQIDKGYSVDHDREAGPEHLLNQIDRFCAEANATKVVACIRAFNEAFPELVGLSNGS